MANQELGGDISGEWELVADFNRVVVDSHLTKKYNLEHEPSQDENRSPKTFQTGETSRSTCLSGNTAKLNYPLLADG